MTRITGPLPARTPMPTGVAWADAACRQTAADPDWWTASTRGRTAHTAVRLCRACPVRVACVAWMLALPPETTGVWGGFCLPAERRLAAAWWATVTGTGTADPAAGSGR